MAEAPKEDAWPCPDCSGWDSASTRTTDGGSSYGTYDQSSSSDEESEEEECEDEDCQGQLLQPHCSFFSALQMVYLAFWQVDADLARDVVGARQQALELAVVAAGVVSRCRDAARRVAEEALVDLARAAEEGAPDVAAHALTAVAQRVADIRGECAELQRRYSGLARGIQEITRRASRVKLESDRRLAEIAAGGAGGADLRPVASVEAARRSSEALLRSLRKLRRSEAALRSCRASWADMDRTVQCLSQARDHLEVLVGFASRTPSLRDRFEQQLAEDRGLWGRLERRWAQYVDQSQVGAEAAVLSAAAATA